jgi:hypothetical protein
MQRFDEFAHGCAGFRVIFLNFACVWPRLIGSRLEPESRDEGLRVEGTSVNVWGLMPRLSCEEARYASQSEAQDILSGA